jgi:cytochrome P450
VEGREALVTFDPFAPDVIADPYPHYRRLQEESPVSYIDERQVWALVRYDDVRAALRDHARMSSSQGVTYIRTPLPMMLTMDPPDHERLRRIVGREFAPKDVHRFTPIVERFVDESFAELHETGDVVESVAIPVPIKVMGTILGVPLSDIGELRRISNALVEGFKITPVGDNPLAAFEHVPEAIRELESYFSALIAQRRERPADDVITKLLAPAADGTLSQYELFWFCLLLLGAANRDPRHYGDPDALDVGRNPTDHLAFGAGIHRCLGAGLAELEGRIVLERLLDTVDRIELTGDVVRTGNPTLRGALRVPISLRQGARL